MFSKIINFIRSLFPPDSYEYCYTDMEKRGIASMGSCCGICGMYACTKCPHFVPQKGCEHIGSNFNRTINIEYIYRY